MILNKKTLEKLRQLINEETEYRSGPKLVQFFNDLGFNDSYGHAFPSRWLYTDQKLDEINGAPELEKCIKNVFATVNFLGRYQELDSYIKDFNQLLAFDGWKIVRNGSDITFQKMDKVEIDSDSSEAAENEFLNREFTNVNLQGLGLESVVSDVL